MFGGGGVGLGGSRTHSCTSFVMYAMASDTVTPISEDAHMCSAHVGSRPVRVFHFRDEACGISCPARCSHVGLSHCCICSHAGGIEP